MTAVTTCAIDQAPRDTAITDTWEYDAFGNVLNRTGSTPNEMLYRGEQYDPDLGLYYLRARYYNPLTGRFMSRDPNEGNIRIPATLHKYLYASGDPVNRVDPSGRDDLFENVLIEGGSLPSYPGVRAAGYATADLLCAAAKYLASAFQYWPPGAPSPIGIPVWFIKGSAAGCTGLGF